MTLVPNGASEAPRLTFERLGISGRVICRWKASDNPTSMVYKTFPNLAPFFKMAAKMADFLLKNVYTYILVYIEAVFQILMAKVMFLNKAQIGVATLKRWDCF